MGVLPPVFDLDARGRAAARLLVASDLQRLALDGAGWVPMALDAHKHASLESGLRADAALDPSRSLRSDGARLALDSAVGGRETERTTERRDHRQPHRAIDSGKRRASWLRRT